MTRKSSNTSKSTEGEGRSFSVPAGAPGWVTAELMRHTWQLWQPRYSEPLKDLDLLEMILGGGRMLDLLSQGTDHETVRRISPRQQS